MKQYNKIIDSGNHVCENPPVIFVHSMVHTAANVISAGTIAAMNMIDAPRLGLYSNELTAEHIINAKALVMDLYWYFPLYHITWLTGWAKYINPDIKIITGGYTAMIYASLLVEKTDIDYVVKGDGHLFINELVQAILQKHEPVDLPGIACSGQPDPVACEYDPQKMDSLDYLSISWFPGLVRHVLRNQKTDVWGDYDDDMFPLIPISSGCRFQCDYCYGSPENTRKLFARNMHVRSAEAIRNDLDRCEQSPHIHKVFMVGDLFHLFDENKLSFILERPYNLGLYYDFFNLPSKHEFDFLVSKFNRCYLTFSLTTTHGEGREPVPFDKLEKLLRESPKHVLGEVFANKMSCPEDLPEFIRSRVRINDSWHIPVPQPGLIGTDDQAKEFEKFMTKSQAFFNETVRIIDSVVTGLYSSKQKIDRKSQALFEFNDQKEPHEDPGTGILSKLPNAQRVVLETFYRTPDGRQQAERFLGPEFIRNNKYRIGSAKIVYRCEELFGFFLKILKGKFEEFMYLQPWERIQLRMDHKSDENARRILKLVPVESGALIKPDIIFIMQNVVIEDACRFMGNICNIRKRFRLCISCSGKTGYCRAGPGSRDQDLPRILSNKQIRARRKCKKCPVFDQCSRCFLPVVEESTYCKLKQTKGINTLLSFPIIAALKAKEREQAIVK